MSADDYIARGILGLMWICIHVVDAYTGGQKVAPLCSECKRRSVKCDEKRPRCFNCENRRTACHYATSGPWLWASPSTSDEQEPPDHGTSDLESQHLSILATPKHQHQFHHPHEFNTQHLRLLLNWTTSTCHTISRTHADPPVWQHTVPERALSCPYLLHGIFAVSALHLALSTNCQGADKQSLIEAASHHQSCAIAMFTTADATPTAAAAAAAATEGGLDPSTRLESFALSALLIGAAFAFPLTVATQSQPAPNAVDELVEVFQLSRKMIKYLAPAMHGLRQSELSAFFLLDGVNGEANLSASARGAIEALTELVDTMYPVHVTNNDDDNHQRQQHRILIDTIACLVTLLGKLDGGGEMIASSFDWINEVPAGYVELLQAHDPLALVILAHFCVVLYWLRERWWVGAWSGRVLRGILEILDNDESGAWRGALDWVLDAVKV
ncbi:hypothetical protein BJY01DRAFT_250606 [Aspergillus pseudoustus]|uniref:Zn(2)-C6 fungal-type domain-containing protein n=1 Tax=Aspergillus pseudoustus TaxID=1810923 RepID=A0ABR4JJN3_9EURO